MLNVSKTNTEANKVIDACTETIRSILNGSLPPPDEEWRQGVGGWRYKLVRAGGDTPPGRKPVGLFWLAWPPEPPEESYRRQVAALIKGEEAPPPPTTYQVFVAPYRGILGWFYQHSKITVVGPSPRRLGDLPLVFATPKTPGALLKAQVGIALWRQDTEQPQWKQEFEAWLLQWLTQFTGKDGAGEIANCLLRQFSSVADGSLTNYIRRCLLNKKKGFTIYIGGEAFTVESRSQVQQAADKMECSKRTVYRHLQHLGFYRETLCRRQDGDITLISLRRKYEITAETLGEVEGRIKQRQNRTELVKYVASKRGVGIRAAQRWVQRRLKQGRTLEEILQEILRQ